MISREEWREHREDYIKLTKDIRSMLGEYRLKINKTEGVSKNMGMSPELVLLTVFFELLEENQDLIDGLPK